MTGKPFRRKPLFRVFVWGCGTTSLLITVLAVWIGVSLFAGPDLMELNEYHPFRSVEARERYLERDDQRAEAWPVPVESRYVSTLCGDTFVRISGPMDAPPLVLLPSASAGSLFWLPNIEALTAEYRVYAVDNIFDFGRSVFRREFKTPDDFMLWLDQLFNALELGDEINLMGISYGGWLASQYALHSPERLHRVVLIAPVATLFPLTGEWAWRGLLAMVPHPRFLGSITNWLFADLIELDPALVEEMVADVYLGLRCFKTKMLVTPTVLTDTDLHNLTMPLLFMVGENEKLSPAADAITRLRETAPGVEVEVIPGAGHDLTYVQTELVNAKVLEFLGRP